MSYQPPFNITSEMIDLVSQISEKIEQNAPVNVPVNVPVKIENLKIPDAILASKTGHWQLTE